MARDVVAEIRRATRRKFKAEDKIRIVLEGLRGEISVSQLCRRESISPALYYQWSKAFLEAGKNGLTVDTKRDATKVEVQRLREENEALKKALAEAMLDVQRLKKISACETTVQPDDPGTEMGDPSCRGIVVPSRERVSDSLGRTLFHVLSVEGCFRKTWD